MPARTIKGAVFTIIVGGKRITVKHIYSKGKRCRVIAPEGVTFETERNNSRTSDRLPPDGQAIDDLTR